MIARGYKERIEKSAVDRCSDNTSCSVTDSVVSEPPLTPTFTEKETCRMAQCGSASLASQPPVVASVEPPAAKFCKEPVLRGIVVQRYDGEKYNDLFHGEGTVYFHGGHVYKGVFSKGYMHGHGVYTWADGIKYEGEFIFNVPMGYGKYTWNEGSCYEGEVCNGIRHGLGTYTFGAKYVSYRGQWHQGKRHGKGTIYYNQEMTSWYEGDWVNNVMDGWGVRRYLSGNIYQGQWKNNTRHGEGIMKWLTLGQQYSGQWENGIQHGHGTHTWFLKMTPVSQYLLRNEYTGGFVQGLRQGQGKFSYASGAWYEGGWRCNRKHGKGKFTNKNGCVFEVEFVDDRVVELPASSINGELAKEMTGSNTDSSILGSDTSLDIGLLLAKLPEQHRDNELRQVEFAIQRYVAELRTVYTFYSSLGHDTSSDNAFQLTRLQFWRLLKDCSVPQHGLSLVHVNRLLSEGGSPEEVHSPFRAMLFRTFVSCVVILAYHMYHGETRSNNVLAACFSRLMKANILPNATNVKGVFFCDPLRAVVAVSYVNRCWEIYQDVCRLNSSSSCDLTMTMRHFVWMLKDLKLYDEKLTVGKVVEILFADRIAVEDVSHRNLDLEISFLEYFEALLGCAEVKTPWPDLDGQPETGTTPAETVRGSPTDMTAKSSTLDGPMLSMSCHSAASAGRERSPELKAETSRETALLYSCEEKAWKQTDVSRDPRPREKALPVLSADGRRCEEDYGLVPFLAAVEVQGPVSPHSLSTEPARKPGAGAAKELSGWAGTIRLFFSETFLPAYERRLLLCKVAEEMRLREEAQANITLA